MNNLKINNSRISCINDYWKSLIFSDLHSLKNTLSVKAVNDRGKYEIECISKIKENLKFTESMYKNFSVKLIKYEEHMSYRVFLYDKFLYEEPVKFDSVNKIIYTGNIEHCDLVVKNSFESDFSNASFALKERNRTIKGISINGKLYKIEDLKKGGTFESDGFFNIDINEHREAIGFYSDVKVFYVDGIDKSKVWINGTEHPKFCNPFLQIKGRKVLIDKKIYDVQIPYSMFVVLKNKKNIVIDFPKELIFNFDNDVNLAVLTDSLDNDWHISQ